MSTKFVHPKILSTIKKEAKKLKRCSHGKLSHANAIELITKTLGYRSWYEINKLVINQPPYMVTFHRLDHSIKGQSVQARLTQNCTWRIVSNRLDKLRQTDYGYSLEGGSTDIRLLVNIGILDRQEPLFESREARSSLNINEICSILAGFNFVVFRRQLPKLPSFSQFEEAIDPLFHFRDPWKEHDYIFLKNNGEFILSPRKVKRRPETYCLKYHPDHAVHQSLVHSELSLKKKNRPYHSKFTYLRFVDSWIYHLVNKTPWIPAKHRSLTELKSIGEYEYKIFNKVNKLRTIWTPDY